MSVRRRKRRDPKTGEAHECWMVDVVFEHPDGRAEKIRKVKDAVEYIDKRAGNAGKSA